VQIEVRECLLSFGAKVLSFILLSKNIEIRTNRTVILPVVLYECEAWLLTLREKHGLQVFENTALRKILGLKRGEVTGHRQRAA